MKFPRFAPVKLPLDVLPFFFFVDQLEFLLFMFFCLFDELVDLFRTTWCHLVAFSDVKFFSSVIRFFSSVWIGYMEFLSKFLGKASLFV